ncbi:hypothetical protein VTK73DRAFT_623 [Phialemonium thermophilum]|uniref:Uncharacterized protein n=1 Tax=Phialemonium thermophilum TaxID=223376 RepID=A0ABR3VUR3_9PEZI
MLAVLSRLERRGQRDTLNIFRKYLLSRAHSLDKTASKLPVVLQRLARLDVARYDELFPRLFDLLIEQADQLFGCGSDLSLETYWQRYGAFVVRESTAEQVRSIQKENDKIPRDAPPRPWILRQRRLYAWKISQMERDRGRFDAAQEALRTVEHTYKDPADRVDESRHWLFAAVIEERRGDPAAAEKYHRLALQKSMQGKDEDAVQYSLFRLTQLLDKLGRDAEAERVREYGKQRISELVAHVQWDWQEFQRRTAVEDISIPTPESVVED